MRTPAHFARIRYAIACNVSTRPKLARLGKAKKSPSFAAGSSQGEKRRYRQSQRKAIRGAMCGAFHTLPAEPASACAQSCECGVRVTHESARLYYGIEITTAKTAGWGLT
jgi:hypothetical protein